MPIMQISFLNVRKTTVASLTHKHLDMVMVGISGPVPAQTEPMATYVVWLKQEVRISSAMVPNTKPATPAWENHLCASGALNMLVTFLKCTHS